MKTQQPVASGVLLAAIIATPLAQAETYTVLHSFTGNPDGALPFGSVILDATGNLYGTTYYGGTSHLGVVFRLDTTGAETVLHNFTGTDGANPAAGLVLDSAGNLYGTTYYGGTARKGVVFKLDTTGTETVLHSFGGGADGARPFAGVIRDPAGNLYGTTDYGGVSNLGTVFRLDPAGTYTVLHSFTGTPDGAYPDAGLTEDSAGNLYGTTIDGGDANAGTNGLGVIFKLGRTGMETTLYGFTGGASGASPAAGVVRDSAGNLYGTAISGGTFGYGVVFKLDTSLTPAVLYSFTGGADGASPNGVIRDPAGNLYGTTTQGGRSHAGVVFRLDTNGAETVLHTFKGADGAFPYAGVIRDSAGNVYGMTHFGGTSNVGVVFKLAP